MVRGHVLYIARSPDFSNYSVGTKIQPEPTANSTLFCFLRSFLEGLRAKVCSVFWRDFWKTPATIRILVRLAQKAVRDTKLSNVLSQRISRTRVERFFLSPSKRSDSIHHCSAFLQFALYQCGFVCACVRVYFSRDSKKYLYSCVICVRVPQVYACLWVKIFDRAHMLLMCRRWVPRVQ